MHWYNHLKEKFRAYYLRDEMTENTSTVIEGDTSIFV